MALEPSTGGAQVSAFPAAMAANPPLPDGKLTKGRGRIAWAWLSGPTDIYGHGILGDRVEASGLQVQLSDGSVFSLSLDPGSVFEDLRVRLVDLSGDGEDELVVVRSYLDRGAALAVYGLAEVGLEELGETPAIGQPNRWLNPAGAADFDGDGAVEIALVETPHIGGILRLFELTPDGLRLEHSEPGFSNHAIGSRVLDMAAVIDWNGDGISDLALPDAARRRMTVVSFAGGGFARLAVLPHDAPIVTAVLATDLEGDGAPELLYGLADGALVLVRP